MLVMMPITPLYYILVTLRWFVEDDVALAAVKNPEHLIDEEEVEIRPEKLPDAILDENVDVHLIRRFFLSRCMAYSNRCFKTKAR